MTIDLIQLILKLRFKQGFSACVQTMETFQMGVGWGWVQDFVRLFFGEEEGVVGEATRLPRGDPVRVTGL